MGAVGVTGGAGVTGGVGATTGAFDGSGGFGAVGVGSVAVGPAGVGATVGIPVDGEGDDSIGAGGGEVVAPAAGVVHSAQQGWQQVTGWQQQQDRRLKNRQAVAESIDIDKTNVQTKTICPKRRIAVFLRFGARPAAVE